MSVTGSFSLLLCTGGVKPGRDAAHHPSSPQGSPAVPAAATQEGGRITTAREGVYT